MTGQRWLPAGWYRVIVIDACLRRTRAGTFAVVAGLDVVSPMEHAGFRLRHVIVPVGDGGEAREQLAGYGVPNHVTEYLDNEAGLSLAAAELRGRTAYVRVDIRDLPQDGIRTNVVTQVTQASEDTVVVSG